MSPYTANHDARSEQADRDASRSPTLHSFDSPSSSPATTPPPGVQSLTRAQVQLAFVSQNLAQPAGQADNTYQATTAVLRPTGCPSPGRTDCIQAGTWARDVAGAAGGQQYYSGSFLDDRSMSNQSAAATVSSAGDSSTEPFYGDDPGSSNSSYSYSKSSDGGRQDNGGGSRRSGSHSGSHGGRHHSGGRRSSHGHHGKHGSSTTESRQPSRR